MHRANSLMGMFNVWYFSGVGFVPDWHNLLVLNDRSSLLSWSIFSRCFSFFLFFKHLLCMAVFLGERGNNERKGRRRSEARLLTLSYSIPPMRGMARHLVCGRITSWTYRLFRPLQMQYLNKFSGLVQLFCLFVFFPSLSLSLSLSSFFLCLWFPVACKRFLPARGNYPLAPDAVISGRRVNIRLFPGCSVCFCPFEGWSGVKIGDIICVFTNFITICFNYDTPIFSVGTESRHQ